MRGRTLKRMAKADSGRGRGTRDAGALDEEARVSEVERRLRRASARGDGAAKGLRGPLRRGERYKRESRSGVALALVCVRIRLRARGDGVVQAALAATGSVV